MDIHHKYLQLQLGRNLLYLRHICHRHLDVFLGLPLGLRHRRHNPNSSLHWRQLLLFRLCSVPHLRRHCGVLCRVLRQCMFAHVHSECLRSDNGREYRHV